MILFDHLPLDKEILEALEELSIDYVFQPIFEPDGKTIYAWEALMRPTGKTVTELIEEYMKKDKLHVLEVFLVFAYAVKDDYRVVDRVADDYQQARDER